MNIEPLITFREVERTVDIENVIYDNIGKLERVCDHIISCRVSVEKTQKRKHQGNPFCIRIDVTVPPKHEIVIKREPSRGRPHESLERIINSAFHSAQRRLRKLNELQRNKFKKQQERKEALRQRYAAQ